MCGLIGPTLTDVDRGRGTAGARPGPSFLAAYPAPRGAGSHGSHLGQGVRHQPAPVSH